MKKDLEIWEAVASKTLKNNDPIGTLRELKNKTSDETYLPIYPLNTDYSLSKLKTYFPNCEILAKGAPQDKNEYFSYYADALDCVLGLEGKHIFTKKFKQEDLVKLKDNSLYHIPNYEFKEEIASYFRYQENDNGFVNTHSIDISVWANAGASLSLQLEIFIEKLYTIFQNFSGESCIILLKQASVIHYFEEVAKIRAFRVLFMQLSKDFGINAQLIIVSEACRLYSTITDKENNLIRSSLEFSAAILGSSDAVLPDGAIYALEHENTDAATDVVFRQILILAFESLLDACKDPLSGSGLIENTTLIFAKNAWETLLNNRTKSSEEVISFFEESLEKDAISHLEQYEHNTSSLIGVNLYPKNLITITSRELISKKEFKLEPHRIEDLYE